MCSACASVSYCNITCQRKDWPKHKKVCKRNLSLAEVTALIENVNKEELSREDFEVIKKLGDGNFTEIYKVEYKGNTGSYFALKICSM